MFNVRGILILVALMVVIIPVAASAADFEVNRFVVAESIEDREPVNEAESFDLSVGTVYAFIDARKIAEDTEVNVAWFFEGEQVADVSLKLGKSGRWRTYSSKKLGDRAGSWEVKLLDSSGEIVKTVSFTINK